MASIIIKKIKRPDGTAITDSNEMRQQGMLEAGQIIAGKIDAESGITTRPPSFDDDFAEAVVLDTLAAFCTDTTNYVVEYKGFTLSTTNKPHIFKYTDAGTARRLRINPVADERVRKMNITVPVPATPGVSVLEGYGTEVIADVVALKSSSSSSALVDTQKYLLANVMFRRCR